MRLPSHALFRFLRPNVKDMMEPKIIVPTVGRVVLFFAKNGLDKDYGEFRVCVNPGKPHAATVAYVHSDRLVNLSVVDANGKQFNRTSVTLRQPGDPVPQDDQYCEWMPYQVQVAAKEQTTAPAAN